MSVQNLGLKKGVRAMSKLLTMDEASEYLGISKLTFYGWVSARKLGFVKVARLRFYKPQKGRG